MKPKPKAQTLTQKNQTGPIKSMTHNHCHQSCKSESRTQHHSHAKLGTFRSTTEALLLTRQSLAFSSNRVMAADLGWNHFLWAGTLIMLFQMKFKFSRKFWTVDDFTQNFSFFFIWIVMLFQYQLVSCISYSSNVHLTKKLKVYLNAYALARFLMLQNFHISMFQTSHVFCCPRMRSTNYCRTSSNANPRKLISLAYWCRYRKGCIFTARYWRPDLNPMPSISPKY